MELNAINLISLTVPLLDLNKPQKEIRSFSTLKQVEYYPVIKNNKFLGLINSHSAKNAIESPEININDISRSDIYIYFDTSIFDIMEYFISNKCILLPVLDENEDFLGCIDATSLLSALSNSLTYKIPGSVLTLEVAVKDYSISEISNIIESEKIAIVGLMINDGDLGGQQNRSHFKIKQ